MKSLSVVLTIVFSYIIYKVWIDQPEIEIELKILDLLFRIIKPLSGLETDSINRNILNYSRIFPSNTEDKYISGVKIYSVKVKSLIDDYYIDINVFLPENKEDNKLHIIFYIHGGGWVISNPNPEGEVYTKQGFIFITNDYRLSPEYKHPIPLEDCFSVLSWIFTKSNLEFETVYLMGDSAGGNLVASLILLNRDRRTNFLISKSVLIYPAFITQKINESKIKYENGYILTGSLMRWFEKQYIRGEEDFQNTYVSPLLETNFNYVPPTFFIHATEDYLYSEGVEYRKKLEAFGVKVEYKEYRTAHGFFSISRLGKIATIDAIAYLKKN